MKKTTISILFTILSACAFLWVTSYELINEPNPEGFQRKTEGLLSEFLTSTKPITSVEISELFAIVNSQDLYKFSTLKPVIDHNEYKKIRRYHENCESSSEIDLQALTKSMKKAFQYAKMLCEKKLIREDFFKEPPFIHPSGSSYAYHYYKVRPDSSPNLRYMHLLELLKEGELIEQLPEWTKYFVRLSGESLNKALSRDVFFSSIRFAFFSENTDERIYAVYNKSEVFRYLHQNSVAIDFYKNPRFCSQKAFGYCIENIQEQNDRLFLALGIFTVSLLLLTFIFLVRERKKEQKRFEAEERIILQNLAHELRTPVTSLLLQIENWKAEEQNNSNLRKISAVQKEVEKLYQLTRQSQAYLKFNKNPKREIVSSQKIEDYFLEKSRNAHLDFSSFIEEGTEVQIKANWEFLRICFENILENSKQHGLGKVFAKIYRDDDHFFIDIGDEGNIANDILAFISSEKTIPIEKIKNTGIGLKLVKSIVHQLKGKITATSKPTTKFTLSFEVQA